VQRKLREEIRKAKAEYKEKVEKQFEGGNIRDAWRGLKTLTGQNKPQCAAISTSLDERVAYADKLNEFYCRFERDDLGGRSVSGHF
jgi:hypothetical protein